MSNPRVLIIGCGVAGPILALLLKRKGYTPIVLEKVRQLEDAGASLMLMPNGLKVLQLLDLAKLATESSPHLVELRDETSTGDLIGSSSIASGFLENYSQPACGIKRTALNLALKNALEDVKIELREGWELKEIEETDTGVSAISQDGQRVEGSFLVGCDGIKAVSRVLLLEKHGVPPEEAQFTGLTQTAGMSPTPPHLQNKPTLLNIYGPGAHFICYPVSPTTTSWAITLPDDTEAKETWRISSPSEIVSNKAQLLERFKDWSVLVQELIGSAERLIKYGLYDRPHLEPHQWYTPKFSRCVLIGDAAHPTSPHLGQGANQALEDCFHPSKLLPTFKSGTTGVADLPSEELRQIFGEFANLRQPRTAALVKGARAQGYLRVIDGGQKACEERDELLRKVWEDQTGIEKKYDSLLREPFQV